MVQRALGLVALALILLALAPNSVHSGPSPHPPNIAAAQITQVLTQQQTAWNQGDIPSFMKGYWNSPELSLAGSDGLSRGWEGVLARYRHHYPTTATMGHLNFSELEVRPLGDSAALVLGKWNLRRTSGDVGGVFTLVFQRFPEGWKIVHDHTSQVVRNLSPEPH